MSERMYAHLAEAAAETYARIMPGVEHATKTRGPLEMGVAIAMGDIWNRPGLSVRDRRIATISACGLLARDAVTAMHVRGALEHGDLNADDVTELTRHFAGYAGFLRGATLYPVVRAEIDAFVARGGRAPTPEEGTDAPVHDGSDDPYAHLRYRAAETFPRLLGESSARTTGSWVYAVAGGDLWRGPYLDVRERRIVTLTILMNDARDGELRVHARGALRHGDLDVRALEALGEHLQVYCGFPVAGRLRAIVADEAAAR